MRSDLDVPSGALNEYVLIALHDAEFRRLDLGPTMRGVNDLNLLRGDVMRGMNLTLLSGSSITLHRRSL